MIKIHSIVYNILLNEIEAYYALVNNYMNMSAYALKIKPEVESLCKKEVTINSLVVSLSRLQKELKKEKPLIQNVKINNITTKLPLSEIIYENSANNLNKLELLHKKINIKKEDFFTTTIGTSEFNIVCSSALKESILKHFIVKPKFKADELASVGVSFDSKYFYSPNILFSLILIVARAKINIAEIVSTYTELTFIVSEKDFAKTVFLFSRLHKKDDILKIK